MAIERTVPLLTALMGLADASTVEVSSPDRDASDGGDDQTPTQSNSSQKTGCSVPAPATRVIGTIQGDVMTKTTEATAAATRTTARS